MNPAYDFGGQVALVTGAGDGMGLGTARAFAASGASVVLADEDQVAALVDRTVAEFGRLDMAFNNAGIMLPLADALPRARPCPGRSP